MHPEPFELTLPLLVAAHVLAEPPLLGPVLWSATVSFYRRYRYTPVNQEEEACDPTVLMPHKP